MYLKVKITLVDFCIQLPFILLRAFCYRIKKKLRREEESEEKEREEDIKSEQVEMEEEKDAAAEPIMSVDKEKKEKMYVVCCFFTAMPKLAYVLLHVLTHRISWLKRHLNFFCRAEMKAEIKQLKQELSGKKSKPEPEVIEEEEDNESTTIKEFKLEIAK